MWLPRHGGGRDGWEFGVSVCKLLLIGWINGKVLLYSTGKYIQYPGINRTGKEYFKHVCMCLTEYLCYTAKVNTPL